MSNIKSEEISYVCETFRLNNSLKINLENNKLYDEEADSIRGLCGERLQTHGFNKNYELTSEGRMLEDLIVKLYR